MPEILYGLEMAEFRHPADKAAQDAVEKAVIVNKLGESLENFENSYQNQIIFLGSNVRLTKTNAPHIVGLLEKAKEILDYQGRIELFSGRSYSFQIEVSGESHPTVKLSDAAIRQLPDSFILFLMGQAVTMIKGRMLKMAKLVDGFGSFTQMVPLAGKVLQLPLGMYMRKSQLTIDRGGLLACQNYDTAMRYLTLLAGVPYKDVMNIDLDARMEQIQYSNTEEKAFAESWGQMGCTIFNNRKAWANERYVEMFNWYTAGQYGKIIQKHT